MQSRLFVLLALAGMRDANNEQNYCATRDGAILIFDKGAWQLDFTPG